MTRHASKRKTNPWLILSLAALALIVGGGIYYYRSTHQPITARKTVLTSTIGSGDIILTATGLGTLVPQQEVSFGFKNGGQVSEVLVSLGQQVQAGQVLARLDNNLLELKYQEAEGNVAALSTPGEIARANQAVQDAKQALASAQDDLQNMIGPDMFLAEQQLTSAQQNLQAAQAAEQKDSSDTNRQKVTEAQTQLANAQEKLSYVYNNIASSYTLETFTYPIRNDKGVTTGRELIAPTNAELLAARSAYELAAANLNDAQNYLDILNGVKEADEVPPSSRTSLTDAKLALDTAKANLDAAELVAPIGGTITSLNLNTGETVGASPVVTISDLKQPNVIDTSLDETDWDKARVGFTAKVTFDLLPNDSYSGKIIRVYPKLDDSSGTSMVHILAQLDDAIGKDLPAGSPASVDVTGGQALGAVLVPTSALKDAGSGRYIVYLMKNGSPVQQEVEIGLQDILYAEVKSGLKQGDVVLTDASTVNQ